MRTKKTPVRTGRQSCAEIEAILKRYKGSRLTQREFARQQGISLSTLQNWLRRSRGGRPHRWIEARVETWAPGQSPASYRLELGAGRALVVPRGFNVHEVGNLVGLLRGPL